MLKFDDERPFGYCSCHDAEFSSELINEYNFNFCPFCGSKLQIIN